MFKLFGILLLGFAVWQLRAVYLGLRSPKPNAEAMTVPRDALGMHCLWQRCWC